MSKDASTEAEANREQIAGLNEKCSKLESECEKERGMSCGYSIVAKHSNLNRGLSASSLNSSRAFGFVAQRPRNRCKLNPGNATRLHLQNRPGNWKKLPLQLPQKKTNSSRSFTSFEVLVNARITLPVSYFAPAMPYQTTLLITAL